MENKKSIFPLICVILLVINLVLLGVIAFITIPANMKMNKLLVQIGKVLDLEFAKEDVVKPEDVPMDQRESILTSEEPLIINLSSNDSSKHMLSTIVGISLNSKASDYKKVSSHIESNMGIIIDDIRNTIAKHTFDEISKENFAPILSIEITNALRQRLQTDTVVTVYFQEYIYN